MKFCTKCKIKKPLFEFHKNKNTSDGYQVICKNCRSQKNKTTIEKDRLFQIGLKKCSKCKVIKKLIEFFKDTRSVHGFASYCKLCNCPQSLKIIERKQLQNQGLKKCSKCKKIKPFKDFYKLKASKDNLHGICKDCKKLYNIVLADKIKFWRKTNYELNKEKIIADTAEYKNKRRKTDIGFKILTNLRCRLYKAVKNGSKAKRTLELLGCTVEHLKQYLKSRFTEGMSWDNYGLYGWHIDHKTPCANFDLSKESEQRACFHYTNLQPLWAEENHKKSNKLDYVSKT